MSKTSQALEAPSSALPASPAGRALPMAQPSIGARITSLRQQAGITQGALAKALGVSRVTVTFWETDRNTPPSQELLRIAEILGVPVEVFLHGMVSISLQQTLTVDEAALLDMYRAFSVVERIGMLQVAGRVLQARESGHPATDGHIRRARASSAKPIKTK